MEGANLRNGSFEVDGDSDGDPDAWDAPTVSGSASYALTTTEADVHHGKQAFSATTTAASGDGVVLYSSDYIPVAPGERVHFDGWVKNASGVKVTVTVKWFYWTGAAYSAATDPDTTLYQASTTMASYARIAGSAVSPAGDTHDGYFWRLHIEVGGTGETTAGTVYLDGFAAGPMNRVATIDETSMTSSGGFVDCSAALGDEWPVVAIVRVQAAGDTSFIGDVDLEGWSGTAWHNIGTCLSDSVNGTISQNFTIPLDNQRRFKVTENTGTISYWLVGTM